MLSIHVYILCGLRVIILTEIYIVFYDSDTREQCVCCCFLKTKQCFYDSDTENLSYKFC